MIQENDTRYPQPNSPSENLIAKSGPKSPNLVSDMGVLYHFDSELGGATSA